MSTTSCDVLRLSLDLHDITCTEERCKAILRPPVPAIDERVCWRCSSKPAPLEFSAPGLACRAFFCSTTCLQAYDLLALVLLWARQPVGETDDEPEAVRA